MTTGSMPGYAYGDRLKIIGRLELPKNFAPATDTPSFDYVSYLAKDHIRYVMFRPKVEKIGEGGGNPIVAALLRLKLKVIAVTGKLLPEPQAALLSGILLGERRAIPQAIIDGFKRSGLIHVVILSGYSVTIIATSIMKSLSFLPVAASRSIGALAIVAFAVMTGASAMTVRASIMALIAIGARSFGRRYDAMRGLVVAAFLMIMQNPLILVYDAAFQISIVSVVGLIYVSPILHERLGWITEKYGLREIVCATASTQIFIMPLILYYMGQISVISIVPNILILPILPWTMLVGFLAIAVGLIGGVFFALAGPFALVARLALSYMLWIVSFFGGLPFASIQTTISTAMLIVVYAIYITALIFLWRRRKRRQNSSPRSANLG